MEDTYVYISVKLHLNPGQTEDSIQEIVSECDYSFSHKEIIEHEIVDILDTQIPDVVSAETQLPRNVKMIEFPVDPFDLPIGDK